MIRFTTKPKKDKIQKIYENTINESYGGYLSGLFTTIMVELEELHNKDYLDVKTYKQLLADTNKLYKTFKGKMKNSGL